MTDRPSLPHLTAIQAVLRALEETTYAPYLGTRAVPHAIIVLEDVAVALQLGYQLGLRLDVIANQHAAILAEERVAQHPADDAVGEAQE